MKLEWGDNLCFVNWLKIWLHAFSYMVVEILVWFFLFRLLKLSIVIGGVETVINHHYLYLTKCDHVNWIMKKKLLKHMQNLCKEILQELCSVMMFSRMQFPQMQFSRRHFLELILPKKSNKISDPDPDWVQDHPCMVRWG